MIPEVAIHSKAQDERIVREHYDRGDDFFEAFLGERMVYTSGVLPRRERDRSSRRQDNKMDLVCRKLHGAARATRCSTSAAAGARSRCTRRRTSARRRRASPSARTRRRSATPASRRPASRTRRASSASTTATSRARQFDRISSLEMVEHVGMKNLPKFCTLVYDLPEGRRPLPPPVGGPAPRRRRRACRSSACAPKTSSGASS